MPEPATVTGARSAQSALDQWLATLDPVDPGTPSRLLGWSIGHVLTHLARNADSHVRMLAGAPQYAGGPAQREREIDDGAGRPWADLLADLAGAQAALGSAWDRVDNWDAVVVHAGSSRSLTDLAFRRWREVELHRVDLGPLDGHDGYSFADMPAEYVRRELAALTMRYRASKPIGMTELPAAAATAPPPLRLAWLTGRATIAGLGPANVF